MGINEWRIFPWGSVQHTDEDVHASRTLLFDPDQSMLGKFIMIVSIINLTNTFHFRPTSTASFRGVVIPWKPCRVSLGAQRDGVGGIISA
jgi:hypothetical protein